MQEVLEQIDALADRMGTRSLDFGAALDEVRWSVTAAMGADRATLYLVDHVRGELVSRSADLPGINSIRLRVGEGLAGQVAETGMPMRLGKDDPRTEAAERMDRETGYTTRSMVAVPLVHDERTVGVLQVLNKRRGDFTRKDEDTLLWVAERLTDALFTTSLASQLDKTSKRPLEFGFNRIVGDSPPMRELYDLITRAARTDITVLLRGESGTGKTLVANALHDNSPRHDEPFVAVDCAAIPEHLIENELFGHEAGAYTGADTAGAGKVEAADGGTLFLDEVGELTMQGQKKLLRLLQDKSYFKVGGTVAHKADVRFVCATNRDLEEAVEEGTFRRDLLFRLRVVHLEVPPLRSRGVEDLDRLVDHFLYEHTRRHDMGTRILTDGARKALHGYRWPGNVRELEHLLEAAVVLARDDRLDVDDLRLPTVGPAPTISLPDAFGVRAVAPVRDVTHAYAAWALEQCDGNRSETARQLGISRTTLASYLDQADA